MNEELIIPGGADKAVVMGANGTGKTILGAWILSLQDFSRRPWVWIDFKNEEFLDLIGEPPLRRLTLGQMPGKRGLYRMRVSPGQEEELEEWFWKVWERGDIGVVCDEIALVGRSNGLRALMRQGRSLGIPFISCTQRPIGVDREVFSESRFKVLFRLDDERDLDVVSGLMRGADVYRNLPERHSYWYDSAKAKLVILKPVPKPALIAADLRKKVPYNWFLGV